MSHSVPDQLQDYDDDDDVDDNDDDDDKYHIYQWVRHKADVCQVCGKPFLTFLLQSLFQCIFIFSIHIHIFDLPPTNTTYYMA